MDITAIRRQRDRASFDCLYNQYAAMLFGIILRIVENNAVAENVMKDTFIDAWRMLDQFDETKGSLFTWMLRIARAKATKYLSHNAEDQSAERQKWVVSHHPSTPADHRTERIFQLLTKGGQHEYSGIY